ncbi:MAG: triple tyrosine motif-containing protein [Ferruginibacter sp.]
MKKLAAFFLLIPAALIVQSQNTIGLPQIINYSNADYKGGTQTWDIKQDKWGRMYFANNEGLLTYDGTYWKIYPQPNKTILRSIAVDSIQNRVYAGGQDEMGYFAPNAAGTLEYTSLKNLVPKPQNQFADVWDIEILNGAVFFRTSDRIFEYKNQTIQVYPAVSGWSFLKKVNGKLLAQDKKRGLFEYTGNGWQPASKENTAADFEITGIITLDHDTLLVSSLNTGLYLFVNGTFIKKQTPADRDFAENHIYSIERINKDEFVAGTTSNGCYILNNSGQVVQQIARTEGLQNNNVLSVFLDKEKNIWTGLNNGISFIAYNSAIKYIKPSKTNDVSGYSTCVFNNQLYIASSDGAYTAPLFSYNKDISFSKSSFSLIPNTSGQVWRLCEVNKQLLMGHHDGSFILSGNETLQLTRGAGNWLFVPLSNIAPSRFVLAGTYTGLNLLEYDGNRFFKSEPLAGLSESLRFLAADNNGYIWASHPYRGIYRISIDTASRSFSNVLYTAKNGLPSTFRNHAFRINNRVVIATEKGIYEYDAAADRFIPSPYLYNVFGPLNIQYLNEDAQGNIWFCSGKKIGVAMPLNEKQFRLVYFPELTGKILLGFENIYPFSKENIFIASDNGIIHLNFEKYSAANYKLSVLLTQIKLLDRSDSLIFGGYFSNGKTPAAQPEEKNALQFSNRFNSFHFEFSAPAFGTQKNIEYSYQLNGYNNSWSPWTSKPEKDYTNLPHGHYTFRVKARDNLGNESEAVAYSFEVKPAWYNTVTAYILYILAAIVLILLAGKWQKKKLQVQQLKFEEEQRKLKYIHQLEMEKNEKEIIKLQNEKLVNEVIYKNKELADVSMHLVERSDALLKVKDELQRLHKKTGENHDIKKAIQLLNDVEKNNSSWEQFASHFDEINNDFLKKLKTKFPSLTNTDLKMCTYLHLKLSSKEIAQLMNISVRGVEISRYRLRKKLGIPQEQNLFDYLAEAGNSG